MYNINNNKKIKKEEAQVHNQQYFNLSVTSIPVLHY